ncbi:MAG: hypothetical protein AAFY76_07365, partial [Cyanobacteria bacterium J06649_11]
KEETANNTTQLESCKQEIASLKEQLLEANSSSVINKKNILITLAWSVGIALTGLFFLLRV